MPNVDILRWRDEVINIDIYRSMALCLCYDVTECGNGVIASIDIFSGDT